MRDTRRIAAQHQRASHEIPREPGGLSDRLHHQTLNRTLTELAEHQPCKKRLLFASGAPEKGFKQRTSLPP
jgi:hypothetical protein